MATSEPNLCCGRRKLQTPSIPTFPFSIAEGAHPVLYLRSLLLRAGDVEVNPGPVYRGGTKTIRREITPITYSSCSQPYHRTCSGLTRNKKRTQGFICRPCAGLATPTITQAMGTNKQCCVCNTKMRLNSIAIRCHSCGGISHRKCANVSRYAPHKWRLTFTKRNSRTFAHLCRLLPHLNNPPIGPLVTQISPIAPRQPSASTN